jgi:hypothetical protein
VSTCSLFRRPAATGVESARAALGKGPKANPGAPLTFEMREALDDNLKAAQRIDEINNVLRSGVQAPKN